MTEDMPELHIPAKKRTELSRYNGGTLGNGLGHLRKQSGMPSLTGRNRAVYLESYPLKGVLNAGIERVKKRREGGQLDAIRLGMLHFIEKRPMVINQALK